jgi:NAD(P)H-dependent flavin oxidoreductase YrpB (nitropropane dioxygenase family)
MCPEATAVKNGVHSWVPWQQPSGDPTVNLHTLLDIELPIIHAPMAGVQDNALAVAVANAGGLGSLPCALLGLDAMRSELSAIKAQTDKLFNVNFFCHATPTPSAEREAAWRAALKGETACHTALTNLFSGRPSRGIVNRIMKELGPINTTVPAFPLAAAAMAPLRSNAEGRGSGDFSPLWSGQNASGCKEIPAGRLTRELAAGL